MGGLRKLMPVTFATYAVGMLALSGFPLFFSGFWSKEEILHHAQGWITPAPFYLGVFAVLLTAFYMTRQVCYVFLGAARGDRREEAPVPDAATVRKNEHSHLGCYEAHESRAVMIIPLLVLAACSVLLGFMGTPAWPWFQGFLTGESVTGQAGKLFEPEVLRLMVISSVIVFAGLGLGWWLYGRQPIPTAEAPDVLERLQPEVFALLRNKYFVDEIYEASVIRFNAWWAQVCDWLDYWVWNGAVQLVSLLVVGLAWLNHLLDDYVVNSGFDEGCCRLVKGGVLMSRLQCGRVQRYLRLIGVALIVLVLVLIWGCRPS
jgi:NADH-quinone oxidoreductase subunit L